MPASNARAATVRSTVLSREKLYPAIPHMSDLPCWCSSDRRRSRVRHAVEPPLSRPRKGNGPGNDLSGGECHWIQRRVKGGVILAEGRGRRDRSHQIPLASQRAPRFAGPLCAERVALGADEYVLLFFSFSGFDLERILKCRLHLLIANQGDCDAGRLVGLRRRL